MTPFNPLNKEVLSYSEIFHPITTITEKDDAKQYLKAYVAYIKKWMESNPNELQGDPLEIAIENIICFSKHRKEKSDFIIHLFT